MKPSLYLPARAGGGNVTGCGAKDWSAKQLLKPVEVIAPEGYMNDWAETGSMNPSVMVAEAVACIGGQYEAVRKCLEIR